MPNRPRKSSLQTTGLARYSYNGTSDTNKILNLQWGNILDTASLVASVTSIFGPTSVNKGITLVPNPANSFVKVIFPPGQDGQIVVINCYDKLGKSLFTQKSVLANNTVTLPVSQLSPDLYLLKIETSDGVYTTEKFVKE